MTAVNGELKNSPDLVNTKPHDTWMIKVRLTKMAEAASLMDAAAYDALVAK